jgi:DDE superfamily endonuclease
VDHEPGSQTAGLDAKKKSLGATERNEEERAAWRENASQLSIDHLVFIDECGSNIALTPLYARAPKGERARGSVPCNRGKHTTLIAALSLEGMGAALILEGSADTTAFELYIEQILAPSLHAGQIVVMDPAPGAQKRAGQAGDRSERLSAPLRDLATHLISPPLKKPSQSSKPPCDEQEPEHKKPCKKPLARYCSPSPLKMHAGGFSIVDIFFLDKKRRVKMAQTFGTPL